MRVKMGANSAGKIIAAEIELAFEAGAYPGSPVMQGATCAFACYELENGSVEGYDVVVNKPKTAAYRAPGSPQAAFGVEQVVDELCQKLGVDPVEFRLNNAVTEGSRKVEGPVFQKIGLVECLEAARNHEHYRTPLEGPNRGRGLAAGFWMNRGFHSSVNMTVNPDGTVNLIEGSVDIGGSRASIAQQAAETLGYSLRGHQAAGSRHGLHRIHDGHGRQPYHIRDGLGRHPRGGRREGVRWWNEQHPSGMFRSRRLSTTAA